MKLIRKNNSKNIVNKNTGQIISTTLWKKISNGKPPIPPAYKSVVITPYHPKIYAKGRDDKDRLQIIYQPSFVKRQERIKYCDLIKFSKIWDKLLIQLEKDSKSKDPKTYLTSLCLLLMIDCSFRIGSQSSPHIGASTALLKHVKNVKTPKNTFEISFIGKKGVLNECLVQNPILKNYLNKITNQKNNYSSNKPIFYDPNSQIKITPEDINEYLSDFGDFTSKYIRTLTVNLMFIDFLKNKPITHTKKDNNKWFRETISQVAKKHQHTPNVCLKSYLVPELKDFGLNYNFKPTSNKLKINTISNLNSSNLTKNTNSINFLNKILSKSC